MSAEELAKRSPCKWGGGNDYLACQTCGAEYDYRKEPQPDCQAAAIIRSQAARIAELERRVKRRTRLLEKMREKHEERLRQINRQNLREIVRNYSPY